MGLTRSRESRSDSWRRAASLPEPAAHFKLRSLPDGRALAITNAGALVYDSDRDVWHRAAALPGRHLASAEVFGVVRAIAMTPSGLVRFDYDAANDVWMRTSEPLVPPYCPPAVVAMGTRGFLAVGGAKLGGDNQCGAAELRTFELPSSSSAWLERAPKSITRFESALLANESLALAIYRAGAEGPTRYALYDAVTVAWSELPTIAFDGARFALLEGTAFTLPNGDFMLPGTPEGGNPYWAFATPYARFDARCRWFRPAAWLPLRQWEGVPVPLADGRVLLAGGYADSPSRGLYPALGNGVYDVTRDAWRVILPARPSTGHAAARVKAGILLAGGSPGGCGTFCEPRILTDAMILRR